MHRRPAAHVAFAAVCLLAAALPAYAHDPMLLLRWLVAILLIGVALANGAKYLVACLLGSQVRHKASWTFVVVGFWEAIVLIAAAILPALLIELLDLGSSTDLEGPFGLVAVSLVYSVLAVFPNALLLRNEEAQTVRAVLASGRNLLYAWLLGCFLLPAIHVASLTVSFLGGI